MANVAAEQELIGLEHKYWQSLVDQDLDTTLALTEDPCLIAGAQGVASIDHAAYSKMMESPSWTLERFDLSDVKVRMLGDDTAVIAYKVHEQMTLDGKPLQFDAADASTWVRRNGSWRCALHTESIAGDPFGRDKTEAGKKSPTKRSKG